MNNELKEAYENTNYIVSYRNETILLRIGKCSKNMDNLLENYNLSTYAFLTAANPNSVLTDPEENKKANLLLENKIKLENYIYCQGIGESIDRSWREDSYCVLGISIDQALLFSNEFSQNAFLFGEKNNSPKLIWCV